METFFTGIGKTLSWIVNWLWLPAEAIMSHWFMASTDNTTEILLKTESAPTSPQEPPIAPIPAETVTTSSAPKPTPNGQIKPTLTQICTYMRDFEGLKKNPRTGQPDPNWRNNNPLNCKFFYGGYLPMYEPVGHSPADFAVFKDYQTGWLYGFNMIKNKIKHHPNWTIRDMIADHAPSSDNNPVDIYAETVAHRAGVDKSFPVSQIVLV